MSSFGSFKQALRQTMVAIPTPLAVGSFKNLAVGQVGLFSEKSDGTISIATGSEENAKFIIAQGVKVSPATGYFFPKGARKTKPFKASNIIAFRGTKANRNHQGDIVALGYDGIDASKSLTAMLDTKDLIINVRLWGSLINTVTGNSKDLKFKINVDKGCLGENYDLTTAVSGEKIADSILAQVDKSLFTYGYKMKDLIQVRKVSKYAVTPNALTGLIPFHKFEVSICDDGTGLALGKVQSRYTSIPVVRTKRLSGISTYEVWTADTFTNGSYVPTVPSPVSLSTRTVAECETCPAGSTKVNSAKAYRLAGAIANTIPTIPNAISTTLVGSTITNKVYLVVMPDTVSDATVSTSATGQGYTSTLLSVTRDICNFTATTYAWSNVGSATKAPATWKITLADTVCGTDRLADLQVAYPGYTVAIDATGTCGNTYSISNYSEQIEPGCFPEDYKFKAPEAFESVKWVKFVATVTTPTCTTTTTTEPCAVWGVIFESKVAEQPQVNIDNILYNYYDVNSTYPVRIEVSVHSLDVNQNQCDEIYYPVTKLQTTKLPIGQGRYVIERERESLGANEGKVINANPGYNKTMGIDFNAVDGKWYDEYQVEYTDVEPTVFGDSDVHYKKLLSVWFEEGQGKEFESLINSLIAKQDLKLKPVYL